MNPPGKTSEASTREITADSDSDGITNRRLNSFERHFLPDFPAFVEKVLRWNPDYIVPVAKKACKLLRTVQRLIPLQRNRDLVKYRSFFELTDAPVKGKRIAVVDDATQYTSTLLDYRRYFESRGALVGTFCFVGHDELRQGLRWKDDTQADVAKWLSEPVYQEYILQQSYHLLTSGAHFDLDHLIFEVPLRQSDLESLLTELRPRGYLLFVEDYFLTTPTKRFSLDAVSFFGTIPYLNHKSISIGPIRKIKFAYDADEERLSFSPLVFPSWRYSEVKYTGPLFESVPFALPYARAEHLEGREESALLRTYGNIQFVAAVSLAKAFVDEVLSQFGNPSAIAMRRNDLDALIGFSSANEFINSTKRFLDDTSSYDFGKPIASNHNRHKFKYHSFAAVIDDLKRGYQQKLAARKSRVGVHHFVTYQDLFTSYYDPVELSEHLDYYCDFGILVPGTVIQDGHIMRGCRTGEPDGDLNWRRTQILIHLAIDQLRGALTKSAYVEPTAANKLLANFVFDYPSEAHHELHCLFGEPYHFGTLVRVHHRHRAPSNPSIYEADRIAPTYYKWDRERRKFAVKRPRNLAKEARVLFDDQEQVPFAEIVTYFSCLANIYGHFKSVDVLNLLSICRDESHFYSHIVHNLTSSLAEFLAARDHEKLPDKLKSLRSSLKHARSAQEKLELAEKAPSTIDAIKRRFGNDLKFVSAMAKLTDGYEPFNKSFEVVLSRLRYLAALEEGLANLSLLSVGKDPDRAKPLRTERVVSALARAGVTLPDDLYAVANGQTSVEPLIERLCDVIRIEIDSLPKTERLLVNRLKHDSRRRARNMATRWVYQRGLTKATLLFIDFTGLRKLPEPKEDVLARFYALVQRNCTERGGEKLYGGLGGNDEFTIGFVEPKTAIECAKDIKREFSEDLFLHPAGDVKFGLATTTLLEDQKEQRIIMCWGNAKDCCTFKGKTFRNRGDLLLSESTLNLLADDPDVSAYRFEKLDERLLDGENLYRYAEISPLR